MRTDRLGDLGSPHEVLRAVGDATNRLDLPPPAALTGEWFGASAVIAPSLSVQPVDASDAFDVRPGSHSTTVGGGWIGYLSYPDPGADGRPGRIPEAAGGWTDCVLRCDRDRQWWFESLSGAPMPDWLAEALTTPAPARAYRIDWDAADRQAHRAGVLACLEAIRAGEVYQACVCTQFAGTIAGEPLDFFIDGVARTAPARAAYIAGPWGAVASLSPELFLCRRGDLVTSSPIKGTLPLYAPPSALRESSKDVAENVMIVDLVRNDLGRVAVTGSVTVPELLVVRPAPGVWHLVSTVSAQVPIELPTSTLLDATFPPASITGTPENPRAPAYFAVGAVEPWSVLRHSRFGVAGSRLRTERRDPHGGIRRSGQRGAGVGRRDHRGLRRRRRMGGMPAQGGADHRSGRRVSRAIAAPRRRAHAVTALPA